jgi:hypothetical protein
MAAVNDRLFRDLLAGSAPLVVWALHFFAAYVLVALLCCRAPEPTLRGALLAVSVAALATIAWQLYRPRGAPSRRRARAGRRAVDHAAGAGGAAMRLRLTRGRARAGTGVCRRAVMQERR